MKKLIAHEREFLNQPFMTSVSSNICYRIILYSEDKLKGEDKYCHANISFVINDCNKQINLEFQIDTKEQMANSLFKVRTIRSMCDKMEQHLKEARLLILEGQKKLREIESTEKK